MRRRLRILAGFLVGVAILIGPVALAQGPTPAVVQAALRAFLTQVHTWTATQTFSTIIVSSCTGCGGGGDAPDDAQYWVGAANSVLTAEKNLGVLTTALVINTAGVPSAYAGVTCTNQFLRVLSAVGGGTCASVAVGSDISGFGANVATALGVAIGSAGAPVLFNGAGGTPSSLALANATGLPLTTGVTGVLPFANGGTNLSTAADDTVPLSSGSAWVATAVTNCVDTDGNHLNYTASTNSFSCGTTSSGAFAPRTLVATAYETAARNSATVTGTAAVTYGAFGVSLDTSAIITSSADVTTTAVQTTNGGGVLTSYPGTFGASGYFNNFGTDFQVFVGLGDVTVAGAGITFTPDHVGFKITRAASGTASLYATQADGTTETASAALTTLVASDGFDLSLVLTSASSVSYYWRKNGGAWSAPTTLTTNVPDLATTGNIRGSVSNASVASQTRFLISGAYYTR